MAIYELKVPADWLALCRRYPIRVDDGSIVPDWTTVAQDYDVVHMTTAGLLSTQFAPLSIDGHPAVLTGWDVESACWLRPDSIRSWGRS